MMPAKDLKDVLKNASVVTALDSTDKVIVADADGVQKLIRRKSLVRNTSDITGADNPQWIRIASFYQTASALLSITTQWGQVPGLHLVLDMILHQNSTSYCKMSVLSNLYNNPSAIVDKVRVVCRSNNQGYIDIHYNANSKNCVMVESLFDVNCDILSTADLNAEIPEGYSAREFSIASASQKAESITESDNSYILPGGG